MAIKLYNNTTLQVSGLQVYNAATKQTVVFASNEALQEYVKGQTYIATLLQCDSEEYAQFVTVIQLQTHMQHVNLQELQAALQELQSEYSDNLLGDIAAAIAEHSTTLA